jgi:hypothetical protein
LFRIPRTAPRTTSRRPTGRGLRSRLHRAACVVIATTAACAGLLTVTATPAMASHNNPLVTVSGHIACGLASVDSVSYRADNGESGFASISSSGINQVASKIAGRQIPGLGFIEVETYTFTLNDVPRENGTHVYLSVSCSNVLGGSTFSADFGVRRPFWGTEATRHVCDPEIVQVLGCTI